jgi:predicted ribosomally synthesized peptide with SipW-like signal peptide
MRSFQNSGKLRSLAITGALSIAGLGLIGVGAHATFTQNTTSSQSITAGTVAVAVSASDAPGCTNYEDGCQSLTLNPLGPVGSSFTTGDQTVTATSTGSLPANETSWTLTASPGNQLENEASLCIVRQASSGPWSSNPWVYYNGPLSDESGVVVPISGWPALITGGATDTYIVNVYAGNETTACGAATYSSSPQWTAATAGPSTAPSLSNDSQGLNTTVSVALTYAG